MNKRYLGFVMAACLPAFCIADSITLHPVADTGLFSTDPNNNMGGNLNFVAGTNGRGQPTRALIRFDPANQIPSNAVIQSVTLTLQMVKEPLSLGVASVFDLHRVLVDWGEGTGQGNSGIPATNGEATWNTRFFPSIHWTQPGGAASSDYSSLVSASLPMSDLGSYTFNSTSNLVIDVQQWLNNPGTNFGWLLISEDEATSYTARRFASREDLVNAPALQVQYVVPIAPPILCIGVSGGIAQISFLAAGGKAYTVEYRDALDSGTWTTLTNLPPSSATTNETVNDPILNRPHRCYRIGTSP